MLETDEIKKARVEALKASLERALIGAAVECAPQPPKSSRRHQLLAGERPVGGNEFAEPTRQRRARDAAGLRELSAALKTIAKGRK